MLRDICDVTWCFVKAMSVCWQTSNEDCIQLRSYSSLQCGRYMYISTCHSKAHVLTVAQLTKQKVSRDASPKVALFLSFIYHFAMIMLCINTEDTWRPVNNTTQKCLDHIIIVCIGVHNARVVVCTSGRWASCRSTSMWLTPNLSSIVTYLLHCLYPALFIEWPQHPTFNIQFSYPYIPSLPTISSQSTSTLSYFRYFT
jgi:hypothetical protein